MNGTIFFVESVAKFFPEHLRSIASILGIHTVVYDSDVNEWAMMLGRKERTDNSSATQPKSNLAQVRYDSPIQAHNRADGDGNGANSASTAASTTDGSTAASSGGSTTEASLLNLPYVLCDMRIFIDDTFVKNILVTEILADPDFQKAAKKGVIDAHDRKWEEM